jgi:hypothetical protein
MIPTTPPLLRAHDAPLLRRPVVNVCARGVRVVGIVPSDRVLNALADAREMGLRSVYCGGLWHYELAEPFAWRRVEVGGA